MFEHHSQPLLPRPLWLRRLTLSGVVAVAIVGAALGIGVAGYHVFVGLDWLDATLNAAMILSGMGPVDRLGTVAGKIFAIFYALFSGVVFIGVAGILVAPWAHRLLHGLHAELDNDD